MAFTLVPKFEIGFGTNNPYAYPITYTDCTSRFISASWQRGRNRELDAIGSGSASAVVDNSDRAFEALYASSPYYPHVRPGIWMRLSMALDGVTYYCFTCQIADPSVEWESPTDLEATLSGVDAAGLLGRTNIRGVVAPPTEPAGTRMNRVLDGISWPSALRNIAAGGTSVNAILSNNKVWPYLQDIADIRPGMLFVDGQGRICSFATFFSGALPSKLGPNGVDFTSPAVRVPWDQVANSIDTTNANGQRTVVNDTASQAQYGVINKSLSSQIATAPIATYLSRYKWPVETFDSVTVVPREAFKADYLFVLKAELGNTGTLERVSDNGSYSAPIIVQSMSHSVEKQGPKVSWTANYRLTGRQVTGA